MVTALIIVSTLAVILLVTSIVFATLALKYYERWTATCENVEEALDCIDAKYSELQFAVKNSFMLVNDQAVRDFVKSTSDVRRCVIRVAKKIAGQEDGDQK